MSDAAVTAAFDTPPKKQRKKKQNPPVVILEMIEPGPTVPAGSFKLVVADGKPFKGKVEAKAHIDKNGLFGEFQIVRVLCKIKAEEIKGVKITES